MPRERGSGLYCGSSWFPLKTRSSPFQTCRKIVSTPGGRRKAAAIFAPAIGTLSPSVITKISRLRAVGVKKRRLTIVSSAASRVAVETNEPCGGGRSMPSDLVERRREDVVVRAREEMRKDAIGERGDPDRHVRRRQRGSAVRRRSPARSGSESAGSSAPASSERCRARRSPPRRRGRACRRSTRAAAAPRQARAEPRRRRPPRRRRGGRAAAAPASRSRAGPTRRDGGEARARRAARRRRARSAHPAA